MSYEDQIDYLKRHRKSRLQPIMSSELTDIQKVMNGLNKVIEGKEDRVTQQFNDWIEKLKNFGFSGEITNNQAVLEKNDIIAIVSINKGKMKYYAHFEIKPALSKAACNEEQMIENIIKSFHIN